MYKNKASVKDLAKSDKSVTLYAVWKPKSWAVGTFTDKKGKIAGKAATVTLTVASDGKISGKFVRTSDNKAFSFKADAFTTFSDGALCVTTTIAYGSKTCDLDISVWQEETATVSLLLVTYKDKDYGEAHMKSTAK